MNPTPTKPFWQSAHIWRAVCLAVLGVLLPYLPQAAHLLPGWSQPLALALIASLGGVNAISARATTNTAITLTGDPNA